MAIHHYLAFDLGAESGRAVLGRLEEGRLELEEKHRFANPTGRINGHLHWNLMSQWEELKTGLRRAAGDPARRAGAAIEIHGIGIDTWGLDFGLVGADGDVLGSPFHYRDSRTDGIMDRAFERVGRQQIFQATGVQFMSFNTLYQVMAMCQSQGKLLDAAETLLFMPDLFNYLFTGQRKAESSIASTSQMLDSNTKTWATAMLGQLGIPTRLLPEVVPSGTRIGILREDVAAECGVRPVTVIAPGCHDTASAVAAVPVSAVASDGWCYISSGTWSLMGVEIDKPILSDKALAYNYTNEAGVGGTIRFLKNIMGLWLVQECRRHWQKEGYDHSYTELTQMAARSKPFGPIFDPDHKPFGLPGDMPGKVDRFCEETKQKKPVTRGENVRSCLESLALTYRRTLEGLEDILGRRIGVIYIVGGGCQNELLNQMTADACARPVVAGPIEATAIGNILVQAMTTGDVASLEAAREIVRNSFEVKRYEPQDTERWDGAYSRYRAVLKS